jgi:hypothetical protein
VRTLQGDHRATTARPPRVAGYLRSSDEAKKWTAYDRMRILNILGMYRWVAPHCRGECLRLEAPVS